ncbi:trk system potassium uptake protein TrkA [Kineococcus radiotolerans]|uniref:Trk system potassium uptake protein TrkA n=2 Tax=Kineococcus radiotolerans TaxID=131568 RepID=A6W8A8_KINRD|nr:TrkA family potassium uptake protein [Kineococcus radiotolerans]ABS03047.1 TrkA-N domain protein [Kineococcus radiotolerans SRS30216 = ATCC BAA-149]MBB2899746.1 trk system potassium uptake protein TrkA [Kineococcus radiotolerans]
MRVVIAGAGIVGRSIARELLGNGHRVLLIDRSPAAMKITSVPDAQWLLADACEIVSLDEAELADCDVVVAATGDDKANLVVSLLAKTEYGVPRTVARVNNPKNEWLFDEAWGVDVAVSTPRLMTALVEEAVSVGELVRLFTFQQGRSSLAEYTLQGGSSVMGRTVGEVTWPEDTVLVAIVRADRPLSPSPDDVLEDGDHLLFLSVPDAEAALRTMLGTP